MSDGGPAFPHAEYTEDIPNGTRVHQAHPGMSLRDYFAAKALQGLLANPRADQDWIGAGHHIQSAFTIADQMLAARNQTSP